MVKYNSNLCPLSEFHPFPITYKCCKGQGWAVHGGQGGHKTSCQENWPESLLPSVYCVALGTSLPSLGLPRVVLWDLRTPGQPLGEGEDKPTKLCAPSSTITTQTLSFLRF